MELGVNLLNQILERPFSTVGKALDLALHSLVHQGLERLQVI